LKGGERKRIERKVSFASWRRVARFQKLTDERAGDEEVLVDALRNGEERQPFCWRTL